LTFDHPKKLYIMNTKKTVKKEAKEFDAVGFMRERRTKIADETKGMDFSELKKYFGRRKVKTTK
jgi:hypothetical protein